MQRVGDLGKGIEGQILFPAFDARDDGLGRADGLGQLLLGQMRLFPSFGDLNGHPDRDPRFFIGRLPSRVFLRRREDLIQGNPGFLLAHSASQPRREIQSAIALRDLSISARGTLADFFKNAFVTTTKSFQKE